MPLQYVFMTMVDRDDLLDGGAGHVAKTVRRLKEMRPDMLVETLVGDFGGHLAAVDITVDARPDVWAHNLEVVERLQRTVRDARCGYAQSLAVLARAKERSPDRITKSSIMVGVGETDDEVLATMRDLRSAGVDILTIGQYLRPTPKHLPLDRYVSPAGFDSLAAQGRAMGFAYVASGPLVRSSYKAAEVFVRTVLRPGDPAAADALLRDRLATAQARTTSEVAAQSAAILVPARSLVRR
jgi:lipoic acid synthetase